MSLRNFIYLVVWGSSIFGWNTGLSALCNNVYIVANHDNQQIADSWLSELLPKFQEPDANAGTIQLPIQSTSTDFTGDFQFTPLPGASFKQDDDSFAKHREAFRADY